MREQVDHGSSDFVVGDNDHWSKNILHLALFLHNFHPLNLAMCLIVQDSTRCCIERCSGHKLDVRAGTSFLFWGWEEALYSSPGVWWPPSRCNLMPLTFTTGELWVRETVLIFPGRSNHSPRSACSEKRWEGWVADVRTRDQGILI